jgi:hypothetical protein
MTKQILMPMPCRILATGEILPFEPDEERKFNLGQLQKAVGGYIEVVHLYRSEDEKEPRSHTRLMVVNEEGLVHDQPLNLLASCIARQPIVGDVALIYGDQID